MIRATDDAPLVLLLTARQAAEALAVSERTLWGLTVPRGELPAVHIGRAVRYAVADIEAWIEAKKSTIA